MALWLSVCLLSPLALARSPLDQGQVQVGKATRAETEEEKGAPVPAAAPLPAAHLIVQTPEQANVTRPACLQLARYFRT